jgi:hypothetical protein
MLHCPTCAAPVDIVDNDDTHFAYRAPRAVNLNLIRLDMLTSFHLKVVTRLRLRPAKGFLRVFEDIYVRERRQLLNTEDERG